MKRCDITVIRALRLRSIAVVVATGALAACGGGGGSGVGSGSSGGSTPPTTTIKGTAAIGSALANAAILITCKNGPFSTTTDANGAFSATFPFDGPCVLTATGGASSVHSLAEGPGTYNVTSLTELLLTYVASQLGTTLNGLLTGLQNNVSFQSALSNSTVVANAQTAVAKLVKDTYGVTLSSSAFLTTPFVAGQPGPDADLDALRTAGAIGATGAPAPALATAVGTAGAASPISVGTTAPTGGTGGTGGT